MDARFSLGIDLGTSNSAIAIVDLETDQTRIVEIAQISTSWRNESKKSTAMSLMRYTEGSFTHAPRANC